MSKSYFSTKEISWFLLFSLFSCSGAGGGLVGDGGNEPNTSAASDDLYSEGPIDIPVPIAKVEAIDPKYVTVSISGNRLTITGQAGAVPNPADSPQVWARDEETEQIVTTTTVSDGSFSPLVFTYESNTDEIDTSIALAGFDGTEIGTPIFLKIKEGTYIWILTNGTTISRGALAMEKNKVYLVLQTTTSASLEKQGRTPRQETTSDLYTLDIAGIPQKTATGSFVIDQVFVTDGKILVRSGNDFYVTSDDETFTLCCSIDSAETLQRVHVADSPAGIQMIAAATDKALHLCSKSAGSCKKVQDLQTNEEVEFLKWMTIGAGTDSIFNIVMTTSIETGSGTVFGAYYYDQTGEEGISFFQDGEGIDYAGQDVITSSDGGQQMTIATATLEEGVATDSWITFVPYTTTTCGSGGTSIGTDTLDIYSIYSSLNDSNYILDATMVLQPGSAGVDTLCQATRTRTVYDVEAHPSAKILFFCAEDENGKGQFYAYCPNRIVSSQPDGNEIVQLTEESEHCNEDKNWKIDINEEDSSGKQAGSLVIVDNSSPSLPQIEFIDPYTDPRIKDCMED